MLLFCSYLSLCVCQSSTICQINLKPPKVTAKQKKLKTSTEKLNKIIEENGKKKEKQQDQQQQEEEKLNFIAFDSYDDRKYII